MKCNFVYFNGEFLKENTIDFREYQANILKEIKDKNSLVVLPTGLGKTVIGVLLMAEALKKYPEGKILILAPTRPLVAQHERSCKRFLTIPEEKIVSLTGKIKPEERFVLFEKSQIIISTPQVIKNDVMRKRYDLSFICLLIIDEAHRTRGNYAYTGIAKEYLKTCNDPLILGLTASPGKDLERIQQICDNLSIEKVIFKSREDPDVERYLHDIELYLKYTVLPLEFIKISVIWDALFKKFLRFFIQRGLINPHKKYYSKIDFLRIAEDLTLSLKFEDLLDKAVETEILLNNLYYTNPKIIDIVREKNLNIHSIFSYCSSCISILHGKDLLETQDIRLFKTFLETIAFKARNNNSAAIRISNSEHFNYIYSLLEKNEFMNLHHPKIDLTLSIINKELNHYKNEKIIIFTQYRQMATVLRKRLQLLLPEEIKIEKFIGQATKHEDKGFSQSEQSEIIRKFRENEINILCATCVAEEGLDIPNVDAIIFYEPIPSEIRYIQRRGRTGRHSPGRCYILITKNTVDVPYFKVACKKKNSMKTILSNEECLDLKTKIPRSAINFTQKKKPFSEWDFIKEFQERKEREREILSNKSIEEILEEMEKFSNSLEFKKFRKYGITFFSDVADLSKSRLKKRMMTIKGIKKKSVKKTDARKPSYNKKLKTLINLARIYAIEGKIEVSKLKKLAEQEDILENTFFIHLNQACYLGYLEKRNENELHILIDHE
ncbi:MAG: helicase-related protein [Promethearchaeota archaeon]